MNKRAYFKYMFPLSKIVYFLFYFQFQTTKYAQEIRYITTPPKTIIYRHISCHISHPPPLQKYFSSATEKKTEFGFINLLSVTNMKSFSLGISELPVGFRHI